MAARFAQRGRASGLRAEARKAEREFWSAMTAGRRGEFTSGRIKAPPPRERRAKRFGGGTRDTSGGAYDWFYELHPQEQKRIRDNWMTHDRGGVAPDEVEDAGLPMTEWLALTRGIDASRAVAAGRKASPHRYGGRDPAAFLRKGHPSDHGTAVGHFTDRKGRRRDVSASSGVQFFTDDKGRVHPIRASEPMARYHKPAAPLKYDPDEAF